MITSQIQIDCQTRLQPTSLSSLIVLQPPLLCERWGGHPLCLSRDGPALMDLHWSCDCTVFCPSVQYLSFFFKAFSCTILDSSSFSLFHSGQVFHEMVCPLVLLLFFLRFSSISPHCSIQFSFAFFMHLLMLLFTSLYFSDPSGSNRFFLGSVLLSRRSRISAVTEVFFSSNDVCQGSHWLLQSLLC